MHVNYFSGILADVTPAGGPPLTQTQSLMGNPLIFLGLMVVMMYFILIRPQQKRAKELAKLVDSIKAGDKVVTASGIVGIVITVKDKFVTLRSADSKFEVTKSSVAEILESSKSTES